MHSEYIQPCIRNGRVGGLSTKPGLWPFIHLDWVGPFSDLLVDCSSCVIYWKADIIKPTEDRVVVDVLPETAQQ